MVLLDSAGRLLLAPRFTKETFSPLATTDHNRSPQWLLDWRPFLQSAEQQKCERLDDGGRPRRRRSRRRPAQPVDNLAPVVPRNAQEINTQERSHTDGRVPISSTDDLLSLLLDKDSWSPTRRLRVTPFLEWIEELILQCASPRAATAAAAAGGHKDARKTTVPTQAGLSSRMRPGIAVVFASSSADEDKC